MRFEGKRHGARSATQERGERGPLARHAQPRPGDKTKRSCQALGLGPAIGIRGARHACFSAHHGWSAKLGLWNAGIGSLARHASDLVVGGSRVVQSPSASVLSNQVKKEHGSREWPNAPSYRLTTALDLFPFPVRSFRLPKPARRVQALSQRRSGERTMQGVGRSQTADRKSLGGVESHTLENVSRASRRRPPHPSAGEPTGEGLRGSRLIRTSPSRGLIEGGPNSLSQVRRCYRGDFRCLRPTSDNTHSDAFQAAQTAHPE